MEEGKRNFILTALKRLEGKQEKEWLCDLFNIKKSVINDGIIITK